MITSLYVCSQGGIHQYKPRFIKNYVWNYVALHVETHWTGEYQGGTMFKATLHMMFKMMWESKPQGRTMFNSMSKCNV